MKRLKDAINAQTNYTIAVSIFKPFAIILIKLLKNETKKTIIL